MLRCATEVGHGALDEALKRVSGWLESLIVSFLGGPDGKIAGSPLHSALGHLQAPVSEASKSTPWHSIWRLGSQSSPRNRLSHRVPPLRQVSPTGSALTVSFAHSVVDRCRIPHETDPGDIGWGFESLFGRSRG